MPRRPTGRPPGRPRYPGPLTPAELRVLDEVRLGLTNAEIGLRLGISPDTVKTHVASMLSKLGLEDRRALAQWRERDGRRWGWWRLSWAPAALVSAGLVVTLIAAVALLGARLRSQTAEDVTKVPTAGATPPTAMNVTGTIDAAVPRRSRPVSVSALDFVTADSGWMALENGQVLRSDDGGWTWRDLTPLPGGATALSFTKAGEGWAAVDGTILHTTDGGGSWTRVPFTHEVAWLQSVDDTLFTDGPDGPLAIAPAPRRVRWRLLARGVALPRGVERFHSLTLMMAGPCAPTPASPRWRRSG